MIDQQSIFWGVRLSKPDGDAEYKNAMTRPDPPYRANTRPAIEAGAKQEEGLVIHEVKDSNATRVEERLVHVYGPVSEEFLYLAAGISEDGRTARADWIIVDMAEAAELEKQGVPHVDVDCHDEDGFLDWMAEMFAEMARQQLVDEGALLTKEALVRRGAALVAEWLGMTKDEGEAGFAEWLEETGPLDELDRDDDFQLDPTVDDPMPEVEAMFPKRKGLWARVVDAFDTACIWLYVNTVGRIR